MIIRGFFALLTAAFLTGCSLSSPGSRTSPIPTSISTVAKIKANGETFVKTNGPAGLLSSSFFDIPSLQFTEFNGISIGATKRVFVNWVKQENVRAPEGWKFEIVFQEGVSTVTKLTPTPGGVSYRVSYALEIVVSVKVPAGTPEGRYNTIVYVSEVGKPLNTGPLYLNFEVEKPDEK